jgi:hypothetical protein
MKLYLAQTPCCADSSKKLPGLSAANFSKIDMGVSMPENSVSISGITRCEVASSKTSDFEN